MTTYLQYYLWVAYKQVVMAYPCPSDVPLQMLFSHTTYDPGGSI